MAPGLRDVVTGQDGCTPEGSGGNAASALADALLGTKAKYSQRASEVRTPNG